MNFIFGMLAGVGLMLAVNLGTADDPPWHKHQITACAWNINDAQAEDDTCDTWLDEEGNVILGPLWAKP